MQSNQDFTASAPLAATTHSKSKSIFQSKTFWGAVLTAIAAIAPAIGDTVTDYQNTGKISPARVSNIVVILATTGLTIIGRVSADSTLYTPKGFPGPNKPEN